MRLLVRLAFVALVLATFAAFFVTQRLKRSPSVVLGLDTTKFFSPDADGERDRASILFYLKKADDVSVSVVDEDGDVVRRLVSNRPERAYRRVLATWNGRTDAGTIAPDGRYRVRIGLRRQGRSIVAAEQTMNLDTTAPRPSVVRIRAANAAGPVGPAPHERPVIWPTRGADALDIRVRGAGRRSPPVFRVFRTDVTPARQVTVFTGRRGRRVTRWDGTADGRPLPPGTYLVAVEARDRAGNVGTDPPVLPPPANAGALPGRGGVTVRQIAARPPIDPVRAGGQAEFFVDARGRAYRWSIRRVGEPRPPKLRTATRARLRVSAPKGASGVYLLELRLRSHRASVPFAVQSTRSRPILLVLPTLTWQGLNQVDDDGDGLPNTLPRGGPVQLGRLFAGNGLPPGFAERIAPYLVYLDRTKLRYDITTDAALALNRGAKLGGRPGVVLAGDAVWQTPVVRRRLRAYVQSGGTLFSLGTGALRRSVAIGLVDGRGLQLRRPSGARARDLFGARLGPLTRERVDLTAYEDGEVGLFEQTDGSFPGFSSYERTLDVVRPNRIESAAGPEAGRAVIIAERYGRGVVIRTGLPEWAERITRETSVSDLTRRIWTILSR